MYKIRIADKSDLGSLVQFIDEHWKKDHIFVKSKELFDWQHFDCRRNRYNFVIGVEKQTNKIHGILGFIPLSQFDPEIKDDELCWMAIWKVRDAARGHKLGRRLMDYLEKTVHPKIISTVAASAMTMPMYEAKGYRTGILNHYYILNPIITDYSLASVDGDFSMNAAPTKAAINKKLVQATIDDIHSDISECLINQNDLPKKSGNYLINRYFCHPIYKYQSYLIKEDNKTTGILITRICTHKEGKAIRIVDFVGPSDALHGLQTQWLELLDFHSSEYIDFYNSGIDDEDLCLSGFKLCRDGEKVTIPNYFEPFSSMRVNISYMTSLSNEYNFRIVKGDSDQDRPNILSSGT